MTVLALDLGSLCGWCVDPALGMHGVWNLKPTRFDGGGMRYVRFRARLDELAKTGVTQVVYEEVRKHKGTDAAHIYGGLLATLQTWCEDSAIPYTGVGVGMIKKHWTGKGNADKGLMIAHSLQRGFKTTDDNEVDAIAIWHWWRDEGSK